MARQPSALHDTGRARAISAADLKRFRKRLERDRQVLLGELEESRPEGVADIREPTDQAEQASGQGLREIAIRSRERAAAMLREVDHALARIAQGTYGICEETGEEIGLSRLEAEPTARLSLQAQQRYERHA